MGNTGSVHNLHNVDVDNEFNSIYSQQQYLRQTSTENDTTRKKLNHSALGGGWSTGRNLSDCKVLPKSRESLKLRATTNGAILQAGGTISCRSKEQLELENVRNALLPMRRCHTLILEGHKESQLIPAHRKSAPPPVEFRRSQTLLYVDHSRTKPQEYMAIATPPPSTLKVNKYNKKRKAPPAPTNNSSTVAGTCSNKKLEDDSKIMASAKSRIYTTNINKAITQQHPHNRKQQSGTNDNFRSDCQPASYVSKLPYRRENSFDAVLLRQKETTIDCKERRITVQNANSKKRESLTTIEDWQKKNFTRSITSNHSQGNCTRDKKHLENTTNFNLCPVVKEKNVKNEEEKGNKIKPKTQQSRIPQLKRTFYFGMETANETTALTQKAVVPLDKKKTDEKEIIELLNNIHHAQTAEKEEEILDNGILVHVRPTLPRRQPETPSFSPAAAWRNLWEEEQRLQQERDKLKSIFLTQRTILEMPISLNLKANENSTLTNAANWTPQQDLDDEEEDHGDSVVNAGKFKSHTKNFSPKIDVKLEQRANSNPPLHLFSLSLPRDVHLQGQLKSPLDKGEEHKNNLKSANCWLVPGFNSLQKFKTNLNKNLDKCTCPLYKRHSHQLQTIFVDSFAKESNTQHQPDCDLFKIPSKKTSYHNDNWLLHKSQTNEPTLVSPSASLYPLQCLVNLQPKSIGNICGGKHIVYLPGPEAHDALNNDTYQKATKSTKATYKRRQRQEVVRENLQDLIPIENTKQGTAEKNTTHRFTFQSTVRVLEKRRLAEKLSKDAEVQEAQRLHELEAMKRVEEDFQRKRAPEKAILRNQLRLHLKDNIESEEYRSLPLNINERYQHNQHSNQNVSDMNNNLYCRAEPDGAVSPALECNDDNMNKIRHSNSALITTKKSKPLESFDSEVEEDESEVESQIPDMQCTALLIEPYLHSII